MIARPAGSVQQLVSRPGSLLWRADWLAACSNRSGPGTAARTSWPLASRLLPYTRPVAEAKRSALQVGRPFQEAARDRACTPAPTGSLAAILRAAGGSAGAQLANTRDGVTRGRDTCIVGIAAFKAHAVDALGFVPVRQCRSGRSGYWRCTVVWPDCASTMHATTFAACSSRPAQQRCAVVGSSCGSRRRARGPVARLANPPIARWVACYCPSYPRQPPYRLRGGARGSVLAYPRELARG